MFRNRLFWALDQIKSGRVRESLRQLEMVIPDPYSQGSSEQREIDLHRLLVHATATSQYYKHLTGFDRIQDFPVIDKNVIRENYAALVSDRYSVGKLKRVSTSGSTGTPFSVCQCDRKVSRNFADNLYFSKYGRYEVGDPFYYIEDLERNEPEKRDFQPSHQYTSGGYLKPVGSIHETCLWKIERYEERIGSAGIWFDLRGAGQLHSFSRPGCRNRTKGALCHVRPIEQCHQAVPFGCLWLPSTGQVFKRGERVPSSPVVHEFRCVSINSASYHIEFLGMDSDAPVKEGEPGRIVVTDLFNYALPIIRYDTGDVGTPGEVELDGKRVPVFLNIEGRRLDYISSTSGHLISPHTVDYAVRSTSDLLQFQVTRWDGSTIR